MDWLQVLFIIGANLGTVLALYMHSDKKITKLYEMYCEMQNQMNDKFSQIHEEIKNIYISWNNKNK